MSSDNLNGGEPVAKASFGGQYVSPRVQRPSPHSWKEERDMLGIDVLEAERHLQFVRVCGDPSRIRTAELALNIANEQYVMATSRCAEEWVEGYCCALRMGRDKEMLVGPIIGAIIDSLGLQTAKGGA